MKSERRHELQQNVLDAELGKVVGFFKTHGKYVAWGVFALALVLFVWMYYRSSQQTKERNRQDVFVRMVIGGDVTDETLPTLEDAIGTDPNKYRAASFAVAAGDFCVRQGKFEKAEALYNRAIKEFPEQSGAVARARLGLATLGEMRGGPSGAKAELEAAAGVKDTAGAAVAGAIVKKASDLMSPVPMRRSALEVPVASDLASAAMSPVAEVPVPQGFVAVAAATGPATAPADQKTYRYESSGDVSVLRVSNFYRAQLGQGKWTRLGDEQVAGGTVLLFGKDTRRCTVTVMPTGVMKTQIELRPSTGPALPAPTTAPATVPATMPAKVPAVPAVPAAGAK